MCLELWLESDWYFCNITDSGWFWKQLSRNKGPTNYLLKSAEKQPHVDVLQVFATVKHLCWSLFLIKLKKEEAPTQVFAWEHCENFKNSFPHRTTTSGGCFGQFDKVGNCSILSICRPSLINQNGIWDGFY